MNAAGTFVFREIVVICRQKLQIRLKDILLKQAAVAKTKPIFLVTDLDYDVITKFKLSNK